ncbi:MAG: hypothetical protein ACOY3I_09665 [Verrucomicrobiota bacterium]
MNYFVTSFIEIARYISDQHLICDANTQIYELFGDDFDYLDFETSILCFEATHRIAFNPKIWETDPEEYYQMTIEDFIETYAGASEQRDPLFVAQRFLIFKECLLDVLENEQVEENQSES